MVILSVRFLWRARTLFPDFPIHCEGVSIIFRVLMVMVEAINYIPSPNPQLEKNLAVTDEV